MADETMSMAELVATARATLRMTQAEFGDAAHISERTVQRWEAGRASLPAPFQLTHLAALVSPHDERLAAVFASHAGTTLEALGLIEPRASAPPGTRPDASIDTTEPVPPPPGPTGAESSAPATPSAEAVRLGRPPPELLIDSVLAVAADALRVAPSEARKALAAALRRARALGLTLEEMEQALAPPQAKPARLPAALRQRRV